ERGEHLAGVDRVTFIYRQGLDPAIDLEGQVDLPYVDVPLKCDPRFVARAVADVIPGPAPTQGGHDEHTRDHPTPAPVVRFRRRRRSVRWGALGRNRRVGSHRSVHRFSFSLDGLPDVNGATAMPRTVRKSRRTTSLSLPFFGTGRSKPGIRNFLDHAA